jgi:uncharacterized membrane protein
MVSGISNIPPENLSSGKIVQRIASIDILRAITMVLMIFVNDFWSLTDIPDGLKARQARE